MPVPALSFNGKGVSFGGKRLSLRHSAPSAPADPRTHRLLLSVKGSDIGADVMRFIPGIANFQASGNPGKYLGMDAQPRGFVGDGGDALKCPPDPTIYTINNGVIFNTIASAPDYYLNKDIVYFERAGGGTIGAGNVLHLFNDVAGPETVVSSTPGAFRIEKTLTNPAAGGTMIPYINVTDETTVDDVARSACLAIHEADVLDITNNPYKAYNPDWRDFVKPADYLRMMDVYGVNVMCASHFLDYGQIEDTCWVQASPRFAWEGDHETNAPTGRHGQPIQAHLSLCLNNTVNGQPQIPMISVPMTLCSPVRMTCRAYYYGTGSDPDSYPDGVLYRREQGDVVNWIDKRWVDLSSLVVSQDPARGGMRTDDLQSAGEYDWRPRTDNNPYSWPADSGASDTQVIEFTANSMVHTRIGGEEVASIGASESFSIGINISVVNETLFRTSLDFASLWQLNRDYMSSAARWVSVCRALIDDLVASGWPPEIEIPLDFSNEPWNPSTQYAGDQQIAFGIGYAYEAESEAWRAARGYPEVFAGGNQSYGMGIYAATFKEHMKTAQAELGTSYKFKFCISSQTAWIDWTKGFIGGWMFANEALFGHSEADSVNNENPRLHILGTAYFEGEYGTVYGTNNNLTGFGYVEDTQSGDGVETQFTVAGAGGAGVHGVSVVVDGVEQSSGVTPSDDGNDLVIDFDAPPANGASIYIAFDKNGSELLRRFLGEKAGYANDSTTFEDDVVGWNTGPLKDRNAARVAADHQEGYDFCALWNVVWFGCYEGGSHNFVNFVPAVFRNSVLTNSLGETPSEWFLRFRQGAKFAGIIEDVFDKLIAVKPDMVVGWYGEAAREPSFNGPWEFGDYRKTVSPATQAIFNYGRQEAA